MLSIRRNQVKECAMYSNNIAVHPVKCGNKSAACPWKGTNCQHERHYAFDVPAIAIVNAAQTN
jgi:hypothetical protein